MIFKYIEIDITQLINLDKEHCHKLSGLAVTKCQFMNVDFPGQVPCIRSCIQFDFTNIEFVQFSRVFFKQMNDAEKK
jgi:hypothetical protein